MSAATSSGLARIRALVDEQAEDEGLWAIYPNGQQPIMEAYLQQELRRLHALIEEVTQTAATSHGKYRIFVSDDRCTLLTIWYDNPSDYIVGKPANVTVARRDDPSHTWGPPVTLTEEVESDA